MTFKKSMTVALATLATAAAVQAQYSTAPPAPTEPISPPQSGAVVDKTRPTLPTPSGPVTEQTQPRASSGTSSMPDDSQQAKTREEVKDETRAAAAQGTLDDVNGERTMSIEDPALTPEY